MSAIAEDRVEAAARPGSGSLNLIDDQNPWLGLDSFSEETRQFFHGREEEIAELARRVQRKTLAILFGQSGLGKTSILRAGIVPRLRREGYCPVYVRIDYSPESPSPSEQIKQAIFRATEASGQWTQPGSAVQGESLWEFLHHRDDVLRDASGKTVTPLLIFDQFEEIFTLGQNDDFGRKRAAEFIEDLADLVENRPPRALEARLESDDTIVERFDFNRADYRILIALREDYLAHLEGMKGAMPSVTQNRMRLARMTGDQALAAVLKPGGKLVSEEVAEAIVRFISGGAELRNAEVEPSLLSLVCRELNNARIAQGRAEISADLLAGSHDTILNEFYERALADQPAAVRRFIEDEMLTESGFRESLAEERVLRAFAAAGAPAQALATLVNRRLLRIEERLDVRRVELTHDVLCAVVAASRDLRKEREARDEAERQLAEQKAREEATHRALVRARQVAVGCAVAAVVALAGAVFGYMNMKRAQEAETKALQARTMTESARAEAEKLIVYLLDDFYIELEPVGRLDIVADLSKRALDYYAGLPPELRTNEAERNRALALVRYGYVMRYQSKLDDADKALDEALAILKRLRDGGDSSELTAVGLGMGLTAKARVLDSRSRLGESAALAEEAIKVLAPVAEQPSASPRVRLAYGTSLLYRGFNLMRSANEEESVRSLEKARETFRGLGALNLANLAAASGYAEASAWQMEALGGVGRIEEALKVGQAALPVATQVLERRPNHMGALRARALINGGFATYEVERFHIRKAIELARIQERDWETFLRIDPGNSIAWNNLAASNVGIGYGEEWVGRPEEAIVRFKKVIEILNHTPEMAGNFINDAGHLAFLEADLGGHPAIGKGSEHRRLADVAGRNLPPGSYTREAFVEYAGSFDRAVLMAEERFAEARTAARESIARIEAMKPSNARQTRNRFTGLAATETDAAYSSYALKDYAEAERASRRALEHLGHIPITTYDTKLWLSGVRTALALALARQGKRAEALKLVEPELKLHRAMMADGSDNLDQHLAYASALLAGALAAPDTARAQLTEAAALIDRMPPTTRNRKTYALVRGWIAEEMKIGDRPRT